MRLFVGFGWVDIVLGFGNGVEFVVRRGLFVERMMTKLIGVGRLNTSDQTQTMSL